MIDRVLQQVLATYRTIAVVGLSDRVDRPSYGVAKYMQSRGYVIVPVNPNAIKILGEKCYSTLLEIPFAIDIVNVFRKSENVLPVAQHAVQIGAKCFWQQIGVINEQADVMVRSKGLFSVMDRCLKIEHARLLKD